MTAKEIRELIRFLPVGGPYPGVINSTHGSSERAFKELCLAVCVNDPQFGYNFVLSLVTAGRALPAGVLDMNLRRAFNYFDRNTEDDLMSEAYSLVHPANLTQRQILHALLICRDTNLKQIAEDMGLPAPVVSLYGTLWFNVLDRLDDRMYLASLVHPNTRFESANKHKGEDLDYAQALLRAGHTFGREEVLYMAGIIPARNSTAATVKSAEEFENTLMEEAITSMRHGGANAKDAPAIDRAKTIVTASKRVGQSERTGDDVKGLGGISASRSVLSYIQNIQQPDFDRRIATHKAQHDESLTSKKAGAVVA